MKFTVVEKGTGRLVNVYDVRTSAENVSRKGATFRVKDRIEFLICNQSHWLYSDAKNYREI